MSQPRISLIVVGNLLNSLQVHPGGYLILFQLLIVVSKAGLYLVIPSYGDFIFRRKKLHVN